MPICSLSFFASERNLFYETKNDMGQDHEASELLIDIRGWMSHNVLKLMCFID